ncbi:MAG: T9SS type A sorting domain-containing protein [Bacteroidota bacterium]|nr:T9SS type A sorting domain-containing protein [Bacteroidota bacterium]
MRILKKIILTASFLILFVITNAQTKLELAQDFNVKDINGTKYQLYDLISEGNIVIIDFYQVGCSYCGVYAPDFQASYEHFGCNTSNVFYMTIEKNHTNAEVEEFDQEFGITLPSCSGVEGNGSSVFELYNIGITPTIMLIGADTLIHYPSIWPPLTDSIDSLAILTGGILANCATNISENHIFKESFIYPNPAKENFFIDLSEITGRELNIEISNIQGQIVYSSIVKNHHQIINIRTLDFSAGFYFALIENNSGKKWTNKLIIE